MYYPYQDVTETTRSFVDSFGGLNRNVSVNENEFADILNMSNDDYPLLSVRKKRLTIKQFEKDEKVVGFGCKEAIIYITKKGSLMSLYIDDEKIDVDVGLLKNTAEGRTIVGMGAYAVIFPDKYYINMLDHSDRGPLENKITFTTDDIKTVPIKITPCTLTGEEKKITTSATEPSNKTNGMVWIDTSKDVSVYKEWDESTKMWQQVATTYLKISKPTIGKGFSKWDAISISGLAGGADARVKKQIKALNQSGVILYDVADDYIIIAGLIDKVTEIKSGTITFERTVPELDFVIESNNRLWGCRYGLNSKVGKVVNEIYACKQGDPKNWNSFLGISTDSYVASIGSDGKFTGAVTYLGYPIFFKERCLHKVYGTMPSNFQVSTTECRGVKRGNAKSIAIVSNVLCYKSPVDFCAYDGSLPETISTELGNVNYTDCISGSVGNKLYINTKRGDGGKEQLVYDLSTGTWQKENPENIVIYQKDGHILYYLAVDEAGLYSIKTVDGNYNVELGAPIEYEDRIEWYAESGDIGFYDSNMQYVQTITIRVKADHNAMYRIFIKYDEGDFEKCYDSLNVKGIVSSHMAITPKRCDHFRIKICGEGDVSVISIAKTMRQGSDIR